LSETYNSLAAPTNGPLGFGWTFSYGMSLSFGTGFVTVNQENGAQVTFASSGSTYAAPARVQATLVHNGDGTWTFVRNKRTTFVFNSTGELTSIADLNGYQTTLAYSSGKLSTVTDPAGRALTFTFTGSQITGVSDGTRSISFGYDGGGNLTSITDVGGGVTTMGYDGSHRMTTLLDPNQQGVSTDYLTNAYDATSGKLTSQTDFAGRVTSFDYTSIAEATKITDPVGNVTVEAFSTGFPLPTAITNGYGTSSAATWHDTFDPSSYLLTDVQDPLGHHTTFAYDSVGNLLTKTDALNHTTTYTYDGLNDVLTLQDPNGVTTTSTYDAAGNLQTISTPIGAQTQTTTFTYGDGAHPGDVTSMTDPNATVWSYTYDTAGNLASVTDPVTPTADVTKYCYDTLGRRTKTIAPKGVAAGVTCATGSPSFTDVFTYNAFGDALTATDANGKQTKYTYDKNRNLATSQTPDDVAASTQTSYAYNKDNELVTITRPDSSMLKNDYYADGSLKSQTDGANAKTSYAYDPLAHLTTVTDPLNRVTTYASDAVGNLVTKMDPVTGATCTGTKVGCTTYAYNAANRLTGISYSDGVTPNVAYSYDADGQRTGMTDGSGTTTWTWDALHRVTQKTDPGANCAASPRVNCSTYGYDLKGQLTSIGYPGQTGNVTQTFDEAGRLKTVTDWNSKTTTFGYDPNSNMTSAAFPTASLTDAYSYDNADGIATWAVANGATTLAKLTYGRDDSGQVKTVQQNTGTPGLPVGAGTPAQGSTDTYIYNSLNQITQRNGTTKWAYDAADNLTQIPTASGSNKQGFDAANQLCYLVGSGAGSCATPPSDATPVTYDTLGNRINATTPGTAIPTNYAYDQANRLKAAQQPDALAAVGVNSTGASYMAKQSSPGSTTWGAFSGLPAGSLTDVAVAMNTDGRLEAVGVNAGVSGNNVYHSVQATPGGTWSAWSLLTSTPGVLSQVSLTRDATGTLVAVGVNSAGSIFTAKQSSPGSTTWNAWAGLPAGVLTDVAVAMNTDGRLEAVGVNANVTGTNNVYHSVQAAPGGAWSGWSPLNAGNISQLSLTRDATGTLVSVGVNSAGAIFTAKQSSPGSTTWGGWSGLPAGVLTDVAVAMNLDGRLEAVGTNSGGAGNNVFHSVQATPGGTWSGWSPLNAGPSVLSRIALSNTTTTITDAYNGDGVRTTKMTASGTTTTYRWSTGATPSLLSEQTGTGTPTYYIYGPGGVPIEQINPDGSTLWLHHDQLGSIRMLTNSTATSVGASTYDAYGLKTASSGTSTSPFGYAGQYTDAGTGFQYLRARYYDPATGQFLTRDPVDAITRAAYAYAGNSPLNATDPTGLDFWDDTGLSDAWNATGGKAVHFIAEHPVAAAAGAAAIVGGIACYVAEPCGAAVTTFLLTGGALGGEELAEECPAATEEAEGLSAADQAAYDYATEGNKLDHIFAAKHDLEPLVEQFGSREAAAQEILNGLHGLTPASGTFEIPITVGEQDVVVRGAVVNGVVKIGTAFTP
jgi:RHS repeat-associated protein